MSKQNGSVEGVLRVERWLGKSDSPYLSGWAGPTRVGKSHLIVAAGLGVVVEIDDELSSREWESVQEFCWVMLAP